jgi:hypothetical protein
MEEKTSLHQICTHPTIHRPCASSIQFHNSLSCSRGTRTSTRIRSTLIHYPRWTGGDDKACIGLIYIVPEGRGTLAFAGKGGMNIPQERRIFEVFAAVEWRFVFAFVDEFLEGGFGGEGYITLDQM